MPTRTSAWALARALIACGAMVSISAFHLPYSNSPVRFFLPLASTQDHDLPSSRTNASSFSMKQDWALIDSVSSYTVNAESDRPATFWSQLSALTPELSRISPEQLQDRYEELRCQSNNDSNSTRLKNSGPQPPVLDRWYYSEDGSTLWGILDSGSTIGLTVAARGWLIDDPLAATAKDKTAPGGWVMVLGGAVYELGVPATTNKAESATTSATPSAPLAATISQISSHISNLATTLVVVAILSATLGFAAGSSFPTPEATPAASILATQQDRDASPTVVEKYVPGSIAELRVLQERRIAGRELQLVSQKESIARIQSKMRVNRVLLEKDKAGLEKLQRLEQEKGGDAYVIDLNLGSTSAFSTNPGDLTIAQQRAQQERRVTGQELQLVRYTEKVATIESKMRVSRAVLAEDRAGLNKLRQLETTQGGDAVIRGQLL